MEPRHLKNLLLLLAMLSLATQVKAQDAAEADADFLNMLEFIGEFSGEDDEWAELERELDPVEADQANGQGADEGNEHPRLERGEQNKEADLPDRPAAGIASQDRGVATNAATEAL